MWMDEQLFELKERICRLSDEELLNIVEVDWKDYRKEALGFAKNELARRGITFEEAKKGDELLSGKAREGAAAGWAETCARCAGKTRPGVLVDGREIIIFFTDRDEQRFIEVYACSQCGQAQVVADFETEIAQHGLEVGAADRVGAQGVKPEESEAKHRCPCCGWEPDPAVEWYCDKCGCYWNTFKTHGRCPTCNYQWAETGCDNCGEWSKHEDWYVKARPDE
jgi:rubrerythrin